MDDFGGKLRQARERRGISLRQIAASTKISAAALDALERNDLSKLPGGVFSRAFVRSYATEVGLDPDETVREFVAHFDTTTGQVPSRTAVQASSEVPEYERVFEQQQRKAAHALLFTAILVPSLALIAYLTLRGRSSAPPRVAEAPQTATAARAEPATVASPVAAAATPDAAATRPVAKLRLDVHPIDTCWVSLTVDGRLLFARIMQPGEHEIQDVQREAVVEVGNAGAFAFSVNGRQGKSLGDEGQKKTLKITEATFNQFVR
jgi:cytoskeletal protein RodZ